MKKTAFCICEKKDTDQHLCFTSLHHTRIVQSLYFLNRNFKPLAIFCGCKAWFVWDLVANPEDLGTNFPQSRPLVKDCQFGVSPVNYSDSDRFSHDVAQLKTVANHATTLCMTNSAMCVHTGACIMFFKGFRGIYCIYTNF